MVWKDRLIELLKKEPREAQRDYLRNVLSLEEEPIDNYSEFFKFLSGVVGANPTLLDEVISRILVEWTGKEALHSPDSLWLLFRSTVSFLGRLDGTIRREKFNSQISLLWPVIFSCQAVIGDSMADNLKLMLVREYRHELALPWLLEFVTRDENFFYRSDLNASANSTGAQAVIDVLMELLVRAPGSDCIEDLRCSGVLEKIASLWRSPVATPKIIKLLALATSISASCDGLFESLPDLLKHLDSIAAIRVSPKWTIKLAQSILLKFPKRQYILSPNRAELNRISSQILELAIKGIQLLCEERIATSSFSHTVWSFVESILERWNDLACQDEAVEDAFVCEIQLYLDYSYKTADNNQKFMLLIFAKNCPLLAANQGIFESLPIRLFRNSLKTQNPRSLALFTKILVNSASTQFRFPELLRLYPSLTLDVHELLQEQCIVGSNKTDSNLNWLFMLAACSMTRTALLESLLDPSQIDALPPKKWIKFFFNLLQCNELDFPRVAQWTNDNLVTCFILRARLAEEDEMSLFLLKLILSARPDLLTVATSEDVAFLLTLTSSDPGLLENVILSLPEDCDLLSNLIRFEDEVSARVVYNRLKLKDSIRRPCDLIDVIFTKGSTFEAISGALDEWNLLLDAKEIEIVSDVLLEDTCSNFSVSVSFGNFVDELFTSLNPDGQLIRESEDTLEMYLEYCKYGQFESMRQLEDGVLLSRYRISELLMKIPLALVVSRVSNFGRTILDDFLNGGWDFNDARVLSSSSASGEHFENLKLYYLDRIN
jgi:hypothetical protein